VLRRGRMVFYALEPIPAGAEITIDYGEEHVALYFRNGCRCPTCRPA
jgi:SET domain-containing protein